MNGRLRGITSIEVLITVAIVAVIVSISIPQYFKYIEDNRIRNAVEDIYAKLFWARSIAIKQNQTITFVVQTGSSWCVGFSSTGSCTCSTAGSCNMGRLQSTDYPLTTLAQTGIGSSNSFESHRGMVASVGNLSVSSSGKTVDVRLNHMGLARICSSSMAGYKTC